MADKVYCYPGTDTLKNRLGTRDPEKLLRAEIEYIANRLSELQENPEPGKFDFAHLKRIHGRIFQDLYEWAGQPRTVDIAKNSSLFCPSWNIDGYAQDVFRNFCRDCKTAAADRKKFTHALAEHYADLNALHPFREGNGRSQREFTRELCAECGYVFDLTHTSHKEMVAASRLSLEKGDSSGLERIFKTAAVPEKEYMVPAAAKKMLRILSHDGIPKETGQGCRK